MITLRAKVGKHHDDGTWVVELWNTSTTGVLFFFGSKAFLSWESALHWALWRLRPSVARAHDSRDAWMAGRG